MLIFFKIWQYFRPRNITSERHVKARKYVGFAPKDFSWFDETIDRLNRIFDTHGLRLVLQQPGKRNDSDL